MRKWGRSGLVAWAGALAVLLLLPLLDLSFARAAPVAQALWSAWLVFALVTIPLLVWQRLWPVLGGLVVALLVGATPVLTAGAGAEADGEPVVTVLSANIEYSGTDPDQVAAAVRDVDADVLVLLEVNREFLRWLRETGLAKELPHGWERDVGTGSAGSTILSRAPQRAVPELADPYGYDFEMPLVELELGEYDVLLRAVHTQPPAPGPADLWRRELYALDAWVETVPDDRLLVLAGDFNAGRVHPAFRDVVDGFAVAPSATTRTWPVDGPATGAIPAFVGIDHVAARGFAPVESGALELDGTDHRAVWAQLAIAD